MEAFTSLNAIAAPLMRRTSTPTSSSRSIAWSATRCAARSANGLRPLRYLPDGSENPEFVLNREPYRSAEILVAGPISAAARRARARCGRCRRWASAASSAPASATSSSTTASRTACCRSSSTRTMVKASPRRSSRRRAPGGSRSISRRRRSSPVRQAARFAVDPRRRAGLLEGLDEIAAHPAARRRDPRLPGADRAARPWIHFPGRSGMNDRVQHVQGHRRRRRRHRPRSDGAVPAGARMVRCPPRRPDDAAAANTAVPYRATGKILPPETRKRYQADAILWGATGGPEITDVPPAARKAGSLLGLRSNAISTPICGRSCQSRRCRSRRRSRPEVLEGVDFVIMRELTSGIYFGEPRGIETLADGSGAASTPNNTPPIRFGAWRASAFELARTRKGKVCSVDKANVMEASELWREEVTALHKRGVLRRRAHPSLCRQLRHADRARAAGNST